MVTYNIQSQIISCTLIAIVRLTRVFLVVGFLGVALQAADVRPQKSAAEDPLVWTPPTVRPALPAVTPPNAEIDASIVSALQLAARRAAAVVGPESYGSTILSVFPNSQASALGLAPGDVIVKVDGQETRGFDGAQLIRTEGDHKVTIKHGNETREVSMKGPTVGFNLGVRAPYDDPTPGAFERNPKWNSDMDTFTALYATDPALSEVSLVRAIGHGFPQSALSDRWFAELAINQGDYARAMNFAWYSLQSSPTSEAAQVFRWAALGSNKLKAALDVSLKYPTFFKPLRDLQKRVNELAALPATERLKPRPLDASASLLKDDFLLRASGSPMNARTNDAGYFDKLASERELSWVTTKPGFRHVIHLLPVIPAASVRLRFTVSESTPDASPVAKEFTVNFAPYDGDKPSGIPLFRLRISPPRVHFNADLFDFYTRTCRVPLFSAADKVHELLIVIANGQADAVLDGQRVYSGSMIATAPAAIGVTSGGQKLELRQAEIFQLMTEQDYKAAIKANVNAAFRDGQTRLMRSAASGLKRELGLLLEAGADPNIEDKAGLTAMHHAVRAGNTEILKSLLEKGGKNDAVFAAAIGDAATLATLQKQRSLFPAVGWTPAHGAAAAGQLEILKQLVADHADVNVSIKGSNETPLMWAARLGRKDVVQYLLAQGADPNRRDHKNRTGAEHALWNGFDDIAKILEPKPLVPVKPPKPPDYEF